MAIQLCPGSFPISFSLLFSILLILFIIFNIFVEGREKYFEWTNQINPEIPTGIAILIYKQEACGPLKTNKFYLA